MRTRIERMRLADLRLLPTNARYMTHAQFVALVDNIRRDGCLTSVPLAWRDEDGRYLVLSGNHRVKAALEALGPDAEGDVMLTDESMSEAERVARILSHNAINGQDDPATLRLLYDSIEDIDWRVYSGLDDRTLELLAKIETPGITPARLDYLTVVLLLLPEERERLDACLAAAKAAIEGADAVYAARLAEYDRAMDALDLAGRSYGIRNTAASLTVILDLFEAHLPELAQGWLPDAKRTRWVPIASIFGTDEIPPGAAQVIQRAVAHLLKSGDLTERNRWQAIEYWAADYLAGTKEN